MDSPDIAVIVQRAKELRAEEMRKLEGMVATRLRIYFLLLKSTLGALLHAISEFMRPLFSWNPERQHS